ncbi:bifunctional non-homologous end joining protein LigD [Variovorax boronicumulans]|uniref:DNA ligase D n=1 Tax=Variovorax boronicumulans TaxID=436515 RepID=UPI002781A86B|nr:DNA ligase D [Variovorax boronicumulans]MDP9909595.1 bifunctional non-homologous end joining protein LigD [Variovorax boronicumulans]
MARSDTPLATYQAKRDFAVTDEPAEGGKARPHAPAFVIQKHAARRLHYDFRLELDGVLVSWAVPKGPSLDPAHKRMAVHVEDHPLSYAGFEGTIPEGHYGAGEVIVWDHGTWEPVGDPRKGLAAGKLAFRLHGQKLEGLWELVRIAKGGERQEPWLLFKKRDAFARSHAEYDVVSAMPDSVAGARKTAKAKALPATGAVKARLPARLSPQLATLATGVPAGAPGDWIFEIKFDGYRLMARIGNGKARLLTRGGHDWSAKLPKLVAELERLGIGNAWLDGEIVVPDQNGTPDFNALQNALDRERADPIVMFLFDVPFFEGFDLRHTPLAERRRLLRQLMDARATRRLRFSSDFEADVDSILQSACRMNLEGVIAKRADAPYVSRRSDTWLKLKCIRRQEFVVCGYTLRTDSPTRIGSLMLGVHAKNGELVSVGGVGTGWNDREARDIRRQLAALDTHHAPFTCGEAKPGRRRPGGTRHWVKPTLVAEVRFAAWTPDEQIRHASFVAMRDDKPASEIVHEEPRDIASASRAKGTKAMKTSSKKTASTVGGVAVSHGERVIDATSGRTKLDLVRYYESVADDMLPHLRGRPCALVRGPQGVGGEIFFQKHAEKVHIAGVKQLDPALWPGHPSMLEVGTREALLNAAQFNVIEFHTSNATSTHFDRPNRMIFDLDPGEGTPWAHVQEAALLMRTLLTELGLVSWLKTSGGKGLHVVVPLRMHYDNDTVKAFSRAIVQHIAHVIPSKFVAKSGPSNRVGKLFADYLRNGVGATTVAAYSARARPGMGVSMPVRWDDLAGLKSGAHWTLATAREHLSFQSEDPWADYWTTRQPLGEAMKRLGFKK